MKKLQYIVFTDASYKKRDGRGYCGYGVVIVNMETRQFTEFGGDLSDHTIVFGESWAILKGVQKALELMKNSSHKMKGRVLIVTDSKLCVNILTNFIPRWDTSEETWKTLSGKPVKNQEIYKRITTLLGKYPDVEFRITHVHGHLGKKFEYKIRRDLEKHGINPTDETVTAFRRMNARVDAIAQGEVDRQIRLESQYGVIPTLKRRDDNGES